MSWDGAGNFTRTNGTQTGSTTWANARDAGNNITASQHDTHDQDLADGIAACVTQDGQSKPTADLKPNADAAYSLGSAALRWINLFLSGFIGDTNGNELLKFSATASAVNEPTITNAATGNNPSISATGGDTNVGLDLKPKGTGKVTVTDGTDTTKKVAIDASGITTGTTRTLSAPDFNGTIATLAGTETLANKTLTSPAINSATITTPTLNGSLAGTSIATQAEQETGSATDKIVTPGRQQYHASAAKAWAYYNNFAVGASYNVSSVTDNGAGDQTVNFTTAFSGASFGITAAAQLPYSGVGTPSYLAIVSQAAGNVRVATGVRDAGAATPADYVTYVACFGDQP